jgi:predicted ATPase/DNA-binding CsgD family transcriptional regulator
MRIPSVYGDHLLLLNTAGKNPSSIKVGSDAWYTWLANEQTKSFSFRNDLGTFTARRERLRHSWYWYAYRRSKGKLHKVYLGKTEELTLERLKAVASALCGQSNLGDALKASEPGEGAPQKHAGSSGDEDSFLQEQNLSSGDSARPEQVLSSSSAYFCNLPIQPTPLIGRKQEVEAVRSLLQRSQVRILTLTGPGGVGKTRLGLQIASDMQDDFRDGICFVPLASIIDADLVILSIAQVLGLTDAGDQPLSERLKVVLREKHMLLLLDNFEQVIMAAPRLSELIAFCPGLKILVTSRSVLRIRGEHEFPVPPLALPDTKHLPESEALAEYPAVALFIQCAQNVKPDFQITNANAPILAEICARLDGLPLAIELAAARLKLLPPQALLARLEKRLQVLTDGARDMPARQQTLRNTIAWSYDLLNAEEQRLFRRLSVFVGGCRLEAVEALCNAFGDMTTPILDVVASLVDKNLLMQVEQEGVEPRLLQLDTIREFGLEYLAANGELEIARQAHAQYYLALAEKAEPELFGSRQAMWLNRLEQKHDNFRAALLWLLEQKEIEAALRLGSALRRLWFIRGYLSEGRQWLERALMESKGVVASVRAKALNAAGQLSSLQGDFSHAEALCQESLALLRGSGNTRLMVHSLWILGRLATERCHFVAARMLGEQALGLSRKAGDKWSIALSLHRLGSTAFYQGEYTRARSLLQESLALFKESEDVYFAVELLRGLADVFISQGEDTSAHTLIEESLALSRELGFKWNVAWSLSTSGQIALYQGDTATARSLLEESLALHKEVGDLQGTARSYSFLARVAALENDHTMARALYEESLAIARKLGNRWFIALYLEGLGEVVVDQGEPAWAVRLWSAADTLRKAIKAPMLPVEHAGYESMLSTARAQLGEEAFARTWKEGQNMTPEQALAAQGPAAPVKQARTISQPPTSDASSSTLPAGLTKREAEVLCLIARGLTNAQIAEQLVISPVTVNSYLRSIYSKLGVSSRTRAMLYAIDHNLI